ncbi:MAG: peptide chain release factor 2 [Candidatus Cloacimonetes bacterium]|nr:peptide chain release factor 2 [Candidatus Cloacimonadota bacterium]
MEKIDFIRDTEALLSRIKALRGYFDTVGLRKEIEKLQAYTNRKDFWNDQRNAQQVTKEINRLNLKLEQDQQLAAVADELETYKILLDEEFNQELFQEGITALVKHQAYLDEIEILFLLNQVNDRNDAILTIHPGAGGTESQDWAEMLLRMYNRWAENQGFDFTIIDYLPGDEAGLKSVTVEVMGEFSFGLLKCEIGIHRLVRISPFNAQGKRQTSFASVFVYPMIEDDIEVDLNPKDLKVDTFRASGAGGQHVNTTDSAVRITHLPTNIIVQCQNERSQIKNRETAMKVLRSRLYQYYEEQKEREKQKLENTKTEIGWGNQIRSYVFHPYQMVKDHRTDHETGNTNAVMDGDLNDFIYAYLRQLAGQ